MNSKIGVISMGIKCPIIREGDDIASIVTNSVLGVLEIEPVVFYDKKLDSADYDRVVYRQYNIDNKDVIGITESVVARAAGLYVTVDEIAKDIIKKFGAAPVITVINPIYSRNRFSMILKGIARAASRIIFVMPDFDEVGNPSGVNPFTGVNIKEYYEEICKNEECECNFTNWDDPRGVRIESKNWLYCGLHDYKEWKEFHCPPCDSKTKYRFYTLADICSNLNPDFGLLGTNKATEEKLKLFPTKEIANKVCYSVKEKIKAETGKDVYVIVYGDGSYKDLDAGIWELADPCSCPGYTDEDLLNSTPNEVKVKYLADNKFKDLNGEKLNNAINKEIENNKQRSLKGNMISEGTTPRRFINQLASLCDLTSGSGQRLTPIIYIKNYF